MAKKYKTNIIIFSIITFLVLLFFAVKNPRAVRMEKFLGYKAQTIFSKETSPMLKVPYHRQEHSLSCEIAALKMVLNFYDIKVSENDLLKNLPFDEKGPRLKDNTWGDPDKGFVGNIDGAIPNDGYGVYEKPIADLAEKFGRKAKIFDKPALSDVLAEVAAGHPVIAWGTLSSGKDISWKTKDGKFVKAIYGEHTRVIIGYSGSPENPANIILLDPIYGQISWSKEKFLKNWSLLDNKAVVIY